MTKRMQPISSPQDLKLSLIIPFKDRENELDRLLHCLEGQRDDLTEVILINDASEEDVSRFQAQADVWIENAINCGPSYARNIGALQSSGDVLLFLDSDVALIPGCLAVLRELFMSRPDVHALGGSGPPDEDGKDAKYIYAKYYSDQGVNTKQVVTAETAGSDGLVACDHVESAFLAIRRDAFWETGGFDPYWFYMGEDREICLKLKDIGCQVYASWPTRGIHFESGAQGRDETKFTRFLYTRYLEVAIKRGGIEAGKTWIRANSATEVLDEETIRQIIKRAPELESRNGTNFLHQDALDKYLLHRCREKALIPHGVGESVQPTSLVLFITSRCNARCRHCFIDHSSPAPKETMELADISQMLQGLKSPLSLILTGGEPTLRTDFGQICHAGMQSANCKSLAIMTNGSKPELVESISLELIQKYRKPLRIQISIDGPREIHDRRRNVVGLYDKAVDTAVRCESLSRQYPNFSYIICITVGRDTISHVPETVYEMQQLGLQAKLAIARSSATSVFHVPQDLENPYPDSIDDNTPDVNEIEGLVADIKQEHPDFFSPYQAKKLSVIGKTLSHKKRVFPCCAGFHDAVIYDNFDIALCEHVRPFGNLRDWGLRLSDAWNSLEAWKDRARLTSCACIHGCNISTAVQLYDKSDS